MPENISLAIIGDKELILALKNTAVIQRELIEAGNKSVVVVHKRASTYPPARSSSTYRRTRRLGNSWTMEVKPIGGGVRSIVKNPTDYGPFVMGTRDQASVHQGRWATERKILEEMKKKILGFYEVALKNIRQHLTE